MAEVSAERRRIICNISNSCRLPMAAGLGAGRGAGLGRRLRQNAAGVAGRRLRKAVTETRRSSIAPKRCVPGSPLRNRAGGSGLCRHGALSLSSAPCLPKEMVFAQIVPGFELAQSDPRFVGLNLVSRKTGTVADARFRPAHAEIDYLHGVYPKVHITLHAGELAMGLVRPKACAFTFANRSRRATPNALGTESP